MNQLYAYLRAFPIKQALLWVLPALLSLWLPGTAQAQCPTIDKVTVSGCYYSSGQSLATVSVQVGFGNTGTGNITVTLRNANNVVIGTRTITPGTITVAYTGNISGQQTIVSPQVVAFDVPANGSTVTVTADRSGCGQANWGQPIRIPTVCAPTTCSGNALGGTVFFDFNANGQREASETVGVSGITVTAYPKSGAPLSTTTDGFGQFSLSVPAASYPVRLEYTQIPAFLSGGRSGPNGSSSRTTVQFLSAPTCQANLGVLNQQEYCDTNPLIITPCYVHGDPLVAGTSGSDPGIVGLPYTSTGRAPAKTFMLPNNSMGTTWAVAYNKTTKRLFTAAVVRRHAGMGPLGLSGIYQVDLTIPTAPAVSNFLDVTADLGINVGSIPSNGARGLVGDKAAKSNDPASFSLVGKVGIGGMDFSDDNSKLYFTNIFDNTVYQIDMTAYNLGGPKPTAANVRSFPIPDPGCVGGIRRSWALKAYRGYVYAGVVCDASTSTKSNMVSYVYRLDPTTGTWTQIFSIPMTYPKGWAGGGAYVNYTGWYPWNDNFAAFPQPSAGTIVYPQPMLTDIEFDVDGSMVLAFGDRTGMQLSSEQYGLTGTTLYTTVSGGDMLRAYLSNGTYILENNAKAGPATGYGPNNNQGPGFGEFYNDNLTMATDPNYLGHAENALGGLALKPGSGEVVATIMDPVNLPSNDGGPYVWANGVRRLSNTTGGVNDAFIVYQRYVNGVLTNPGTAGKATGLGDVELGCAQANYIELGNRLWKDANRNGVQDPSEQPLAGVQIQLYKGATMVASTTTNASGEYYFSTLLGHDLRPNTTYNILFGTGQFNSTTQEMTVGPNKYKLTTPDVGQGANPDQNDSDADPNVLSTALGARPGGIPQIVVTTGDYGFVDHSFDAGVYCSDITASVTAVAATCNGSTNNNDGQVLIVSGANASHYAVSAGSSFTGVSFTAATALTSFPVTIVNNAPNTGQVYTVRIFNGSDDCIQDVIVNVPQSCTINSCTAVGGTTIYSGAGALCASSNVGSLTLTGQAGDVVRWQTSSNGGSTWVDLPNTGGQTSYNFVNAQDQQLYRAALNSATGCPDVFSTPVALTVNSSVCAAANCDNITGSFSITSGALGGSGLTTRLVAVDQTGVIRAVSTPNSTSLTNVPTGDFQAYQVIFDNAQAPSLSVGTAVSAVSSACVRWSNAIPFKICSSNPPSVTLTSPAPGTAVASLTPTIAGTATPGSIVTVTGGPGSTGGPVSVTADNNGNWTTSGITFPNGPGSVTAVASTPTGGNSTPVSSSFTVAGPPSLTVDPGINPGPTTQPITGTATPGAPIVITGPMGQTLCSTTASVSGTFACPVSLTAGVNNLTVTACNASGCTSQPISRTAIPAPTVAIDPMPTTSSLTPTVSGTATPGAIVAIVGPNNTTLCSAVASQAGSYSCDVTLSPGSQILTAVATNPGGSATATTASFTAVGVPTLAVDPVTAPGPATQPITGTATPGSLVTITDPTGQTLCSTTATAGGTFACPVSLTSGVNNLTVTACNASGCSSQPTSRTAIPAPAIAINPLPTVTTTTPTVSGTATPGSLVSILGPNSTTLCSTTATQAGNYSCVVSVAPGPQTLTAVAINPGGSASATTTSFTATGPASLTVAPLVPGPMIQPITGTATPGSLVAITDPTGTTLCSTTASSSGTFSCPVSLTTGINNLTVTACNSSGCTTQPITATAVPVPTIAINPLPTVTTTTPTVSGTTTPGALVTLLGPNSTTLCSTTATQAGNYSCVVSLSPGPQTLTAVATNSGGSATATTNSFTATGTPSLTVAPSVPGPTTQPITGTATPGSLVTITDPSGNTLCSTTASVSGTFACPVSLTAGITNLTVIACTSGGCTSAPLSVTAMPAPTVAISGPTGTLTTTSPTVSGTATPGSLVSILGPNSTTLCSTTATQSGSYSCVVNVAAGPATLTAVASNPGGTTSATTSFTAAGPASLTVAPPVAGPTTQPVTGTATPGSLVTITDPTGTTLCSTTASASGTFACPVSLTSGVTNLTVAACNTGGCSSQPIAVTALPAPTIALNPMPTQSSLSPTVSGTATPGSLVSILGPNSTTLCSTTATQAGNYSCVVNVAPGPQTLTAVATNPGGSANATTNSFTASGPASLTVAPPVPGPTTQPITGTATPSSLVTITGPTGNTLCSTTASSSGTFSCPVSLTAGTNNLTVTACNSGGCTTQPVTVTAVPAPTVTINGPSNTLTTTSPTVSGTATPGSLVSILGPNSTTLCSTTATASGSYSCVVNVTAGPATLTAVASNPGGTTSATTSFTASGVPSLTAVPNNAQVSTSPVISGTATPNSSIVITGPLGLTLCTTTASASGSFACPVTIPFVTSGPVALTVTAAGPGGSTSQPLALTVVPAPKVGLTGPANVATNLTPVISGTATLNAIVTLTGPGNTTLCSTTATASGTFSCTVNVPAGPISVTAVASNPGGNSPAAVTSFTATGVPSLTVAPPVAGPTTQPVTGTATPGSLVTITGPAGNTLCSTTAGTSGTFSCPVSLTNGTNNLTVTACNVSGCTSQPLTMTATSQPVLVINPTIPAIDPVISGTATPGSLVTITGPAGQTLCATTASVSGTFACPITLPTGVTSVTVTACNAAGCTSKPVTVVSPPSLILVTPVPGPTTQPIAGTATPGSLVTITDLAGHTLCSTTATAGGTFSCPVSLTAGVNNLTVTACNAGGCVSKPITTTAVSSAGMYSLNVRVLLQGAMLNVNSGSLMRDDLRAGGYLPLTTPYSATISSRFTQAGGGGGETTSPAVLSANAGTANAIVDWVLIELRSATSPAVVVATRSGLVQRDGDVVLPSDGTSPLSFTGLTDSQYFVSVKHRNHLGVMTAAAVPLSATGTTVDFTTMTSAQVYDKPGAVSYNGVEMVTINGKQALWAGDANTDGKVKYIGGASDNSRVLNDVISAQGAGQNPAYNYDFAFGYFFGDVDLNGKAKYQGTVNDPTVIFNNVIVAYPLNTLQLYNYDFLIEQLP